MLILRDGEGIGKGGSFKHFLNLFHKKEFTKYLILSVVTQSLQGNQVIAKKEIDS